MKQLPLKLTRCKHPVSQEQRKWQAQYGFITWCTSCCLSVWLPTYRHSRLHKVQNSAEKLVLKARKCDQVQLLPQALHWLQDQARIDYKLSTICHSVFSDSSPTCLSDVLNVYTPFQAALFFCKHTRTLYPPVKDTYFVSSC